MFSLIKKRRAVVSLALALILIINVPMSIFAEKIQINEESIFLEGEDRDNDIVKEDQDELISVESKDLESIEEDNTTYEPFVFGYKGIIVDSFLSKIMGQVANYTFTQALNWIVSKINIGGIMNGRTGQVKGSFSKEMFNAKLSENWVGDSLRNLSTRVKDLQNSLIKKGYNPGNIDGYWGTRTKSGLRNYQANQGLASDGSCGPDTWMRISTGGWFGL